MGLLDGGGIIGNASQVAQELGQPTDSKTNQQGESYRLPLGVADFDSFGIDSMSPGEEAELARVRTPAGLERRWGFGRADLDRNQGYAYGVLKNASGETIHGRVGLHWENSTGRSTQVQAEVDSRDMNTSSRTDRDNQPPVPEAQDKNMAEQDASLVVTFTPITDPADIANSYSIDAGSSECRLPATEYDVSA